MIDDAQLLGRYATDQSEEAFAELTQRHVSLVHSAALRLVHGDVHSAQDVTQQVFTELARQAKGLAGHPALAGWLYTTTRFMALRVNRTEQRRRTREQEVMTMNNLLRDDEPPGEWSQLSPVIEDAMHELDAKDRHAILLRFFQNKSLNEVGAGLNLTENAARMRVERALEKLRDKLSRRGIVTTASALAAAVSANAVQPVPAGFAAAISKAALAGGAIDVSTIIATSKTLLMTTLQKSIVTAAVAMAVGTGIYAVHQGSQLRGQIQALELKQAPLAARVQQLEQEHTQATRQLAALTTENDRLKSGQNSKELLKLRGQVGMLREQAAASEAKANAPASGLAKMMNDPAMRDYLRQAQMDKIRSLYTDFFKELKLTPEQTDNFVRLLTDKASEGMAAYMATASGTSNPPPGQSSANLAGQLQSLLGDEGCARLKSYSDEIPARTVLTLLNGQLGSAPLTADQSASLLQIVKAEPNELTMGFTGAPDKAFLGSQADIDNFLQQVAESNQRIVQQAGNVLTPDQLAALNSVLSSGVTSRKLQAAALIQPH